VTELEEIDRQLAVVIYWLNYLREHAPGNERSKKYYESRFIQLRAQRAEVEGKSDGLPRVRRPEQTEG
jgi:hypothetical protein